MIKEFLKEYTDAIRSEEIDLTDSIVCEIIKAVSTNYNTYIMNQPKYSPPSPATPSHTPPTPTKPTQKQNPPTGDEEVDMSPGAMAKENVATFLEGKLGKPYTTDFIAKATKETEHDVELALKDLEEADLVYVTVRGKKPWFGWNTRRGNPSG